VNVSVSAVIRGFDCWKEGVLILSYSAFVNLNRLFFHFSHFLSPRIVGESLFSSFFLQYQKMDFSRGTEGGLVYNGSYLFSWWQRVQLVLWYYRYCCCG